MKKTVCIHHMKGNCRFGSACNFEHDATKAAAGAVEDVLKQINKTSSPKNKRANSPSGRNSPRSGSPSNKNGFP